MIQFLKSIPKKYFYLILIVFATIFMGVGYAAVDGVLLNIEGEGIALRVSNLTISNASYSSNNGADLNVSQINGFMGTVLNSTIKLGNSTSSSITYSITITNSTANHYTFMGTSYSAPNFYDNNNITFQLSNINVGDVVNPHSSVTFTITFMYTGNNTSNPVLNSYISFDFVSGYAIFYQHIDTTNHNYPTSVLDGESSKTITFVGDVPSDVLITPSTVSYTYNPSTGVLVLNNVSTSVTIDRYYSITYVTTGSNPSNQPSRYTYNQVVNFLDPTDGNNRFDGWYLDSSYNGSPITSTSGYNQDLVLYAKWTVPYTITYVLNGGTQANNQVVNFFDSPSQTLLNPTNTHDPSFDGWSLSSTGINGNAITSTSQLSGDSTLYAIWSSSFGNNVTYDSSTNRHTATNISSVGLRDFTRNYSYTQNTAHTTINSIRLYVTITSSNKSATLTCNVNNQSTSISISTNLSNRVLDALITLNTPIQAGSSYTISCPSYSGDNNGKVKVNGFEFLVNP